MEKTPEPANPSDSFIISADQFQTTLGVLNNMTGIVGSYYGAFNCTEADVNAVIRALEFMVQNPDPGTFYPGRQPG